MFVIVGANGHTGRVAAETLLAAGHPVRVVLRNARTEAEWQEKGAAVAIGDLEDSASLTAAFTGASGVYLLLPPDLRSDDLHARAERLFGNAATALRETRVPHIVLLSSIGAEQARGNGPIGTVHIAERILETLPAARTFLRAATFLENHAGGLGAAKAHGILPTFLPADLRYPQIATVDIGRAATRALLEPPPAGTTRIWNLAGAVDPTDRELAAVASAVLGRPITVVESPLDQVVPTFTSFGISEHLARLYREMFSGFASGSIAFPSDGEIIRGREQPAEVFARLLV